MTATSPPEPPPELRAELLRWPPFAQMAAEHVDRFVQAATSIEFADAETVLGPADGPVTRLLLIRRGKVIGQHGLAEAAGGFEYEAGELFPVGAAKAARAVTSTYTALGATRCLQLPLAAMHALARDSAPFAAFLERRVQQLLALSQRAVQARYASQTLAEQSMETPLRELLRRAAVSVAPGTPLASALALMHEQHIGSVLVVEPTSGAALGILTRHDILGRVTLAERPLSTPIDAVMSAPLITLGLEQTAQDAALAMSRHGVRHLPVVDADGRIVGVLSERDLFALQRLSLKHVGTAIRAAPDVAALRALAPDIRSLARHLLGQGIGARQLTELISHLNDLLTARLVTLLAAARGVDLGRGCWLAFGSEGRSEQTIATDQDNGIVFASDDAERDRPAWLAFAREVNEALDACGYPLCKGKVMASNPECCLTGDEWARRFANWIEHGAPEDLLSASIYFDYRPLAGNADLLRPLDAVVRAGQPLPPRFIKQLAQNALRMRVPLNWRGAIDARSSDGRRLIDLKMNGTAIFVDAARLFALAQGVAATGTRERCIAAAQAMNVPARESQAWASGFEFLQLLRLRVQLQRPAGGAAAPLHPAAEQANPNLLDIDSLDQLDLRLLKETLHVARSLQQRMELDYLR